MMLGPSGSCHKKFGIGCSLCCLAHRWILPCPICHHLPAEVPELSLPHVGLRTSEGNLFSPASSLIFYLLIEMPSQWAQSKSFLGTESLIHDTKLCQATKGSFYLYHEKLTPLFWTNSLAVLLRSRITW